MLRSFSLRPLPITLLALGLCAASGCGEKTGTVSGKVLYRGKPAAGAHVNFVPDKGYPLAALVGDDGAYLIRGLPYGSYKVTVQGAGESEGERTELDNMRKASFESGKGQQGFDEMMKQKAAAAKKAAATGPTLPIKYREVNTTPLVFNVIGSDGTYDFELKD